MREWILCRERRPGRARDAVKALARELAKGRADPVEHEDPLATAVAEAVLGDAMVSFRRYPPDRLVATVVEDFLADVTRARVDGGPAPCRAKTGCACPCLPDGRTWEALLRDLERASALWVRRHGLSISVAADLAQEACVRLYRALLRGAEVRRPLAWARTVFASLVRDAARGKAGGPLPPRIEPGEAIGRSLVVHRRVRAPDADVAHQELASRAHEFLDLLPPPYRQIAELQYLHGWTRRAIGAWLRTWRPIGRAGVEKLIQRTHEMLGAIGKGEDLRLRWPGRYEISKNPWFSCPPPPDFASIGYRRMPSSPVRLTARMAQVPWGVV